MAVAFLIAFGVAAQSSPAGESAPAAIVDESGIVLEDDADGQGAAAQASADGDIWSYLFRMLLVLMLVAGSVYGVVLLLRRVTKRQSFESEGIKLLASRQLGPGRAIHVVSIGAQTLILGVTDASVRLVAEATDKEAVDAMHLKADEAPQSVKRDFADVIRSLLKGGTARRAGESDADFLKRQRERIRKL
jgi:flagellar biogenesis protein FliO